MIAVRRAAGAAELQAALALRHRVFCEEQGVPLDEELDGLDGAAIHLVAMDGDTLVGTLRLVDDGDGVQRLGRLAVAAEGRRRGVASQLLRGADREAWEAGARRIVLHAQTYARALYERDGYRATGPVFDEAGIEHLPMEKTLA